MKFLIFPAMLLVLTFTACSKSSSDDSNPTNPQLSGTKWVVTYYWDKDKDETSDFSGYSFEFKDSGTLVAYLPDGSTKTGQWSVSSSSNKLILVIGGTYALDEMADDWVIMTKTDTVMQLKDDNTTHLEELHFKKI